MWDTTWTSPANVPTGSHQAEMLTWAMPSTGKALRRQVASRLVVLQNNGRGQSNCQETQLPFEDDGNVLEPISGDGHTTQQVKST